MTTTDSTQPASDEAPASGNLFAKMVLLAGLVSWGMGHSVMFVVVGPLALELGLKAQELGFVFSASGIAVVLSATWWGQKSNVWGRKPVFIGGLIGYGLGTIAFAFVLQASLNGAITGAAIFLSLAAARFAFGLISSGVQPASTAYISDVTDESSRAQGMALIGVSSGLGTILGPILGGALAGINLVFPLYVIALTAIIVAVVAYYRLNEPQGHAESRSGKKVKFTDPRVFPYVLLWLLFFMVFVSVQVITAYYLEYRFGYRGEELARIAMYALLCMAVSTVGVQAVVLQIFKIKPKILLRASLPIYGVALLVLAFATNLPVLFLAYFLVGLAFSFANPGINASATLSVDRSEYGAVAGLLTVAPVAGIVVGPLYGTFLYDIAPNLPMLVGAVIMAGATIYALTIKVPEPKVLG